LIHNLLNLTCLVVSLFLIGSILIFATLHHQNPLILFTSPVLGVLLFSVYVLVLHEAAHDMFWLTQNAELRIRLNRITGKLVSLLLLQDFQNDWRIGHIKHHQYPLEDGKDPQIAAEGICGRPLFKKILILLLIPGVAVVMNRKKRLHKRNSVPIVLSLAFWTSVGSVMGYSGGLWAVLTLLYGFNFLMIVNLNRIAQEHGSNLKFEKMPEMRSRTYRAWFAVVIFPYNVNYHFEHHLSMVVPWYRLPAYACAIRQLLPVPVRNSVQTNGFGQFLDQLAAKRHNFDDTRASKRFMI
jgi:fatty acid desaturase